MHTPDQLHLAGLQVFPCTVDKNPAIPKGTSWQSPENHYPNAAHWPSRVLGVPVPEGVVVIDIDTYKGVTLQDVEQALGCRLPWAQALMQRTMRGGEHYAFKATWPVKQGSNIGVVGLDTRIGGRGYICTGEGYTQANYGPFVMAYPDHLPELPDGCRPLLELVERERATTELPEGERDADQIIAALRHIDPTQGRNKWLSIGLALRHHFHDDPESGFALFNSWSAGALHDDGEPPNYDGDSIEGQFFSFKPEGGTTIGTLYYEAMAGGWTPPATFDSSAAFGKDAAPVDVYGALIDKILESGGDPKKTYELTTEIETLPGNLQQRTMLFATLQRELKDGGLLTKAVKDTLQAPTAKPRGVYGKNDFENARTFLSTVYPNGTLLRSDQVFYVYNGKVWEAKEKDDVRRSIAAAMASSSPQHSNIESCLRMVKDICGTPPHKIGDIDPDLVLFQNGVLRLSTGSLGPHTPELFTTNIKPYEYDPNAACPNWLRFLDTTLEGDKDRIHLLQEWFGYLFTRSYAHHKVLLLLGPRRSGKGTIGRVLAKVMGREDFFSGSLSAFASDAYVEAVRTKTAIFIGDAEKSINRSIAGQVVERIKNISGNDELTYGRKFMSTLSETIPARITIAANHIPQLFDDSGALGGRIMPLPFYVSFSGREDIDLIDKLLPEVPGIALWALQGMARLAANKRFTSPDASRAESDFLAESYSPLLRFMEDVCTFGGEEFVSCADLFNTYKGWALENQEDHVLGRNRFIGTFKDVVRGKPVRYGPHRVNAGVTRGFKGLRLAAAVSPFTGPELKAVK